MSDFIDRLKVERNELKDKLDKLNAFIHGDNFEKVDRRQQHLLIIQAEHMKNYLEILSTRLWLLHGNK